MWNKLSIRTKITLLTATILCLISILTFIFTVQNAATIFIISDNNNLSINEQDLQAPFNFEYAQHIFRLNSLYMMIFFTISGTFLIWWVSGKVLKPMKQFSKLVKNLDIDKINEDINIVTGLDEVGDLQLAFNYMLKNIRDSYEKQRRFSQNAAHELKTPVAAIKANLEVLNMDDSPSNEDYKDFVKVVDRQIETMNAIVQGLRLLSSGENLILTDFYPNKVIQDILLDLNECIESKKLSVNTYYNDNNLCINADSILMKQAIFNIIHNALRYSQKGNSIEIILDRKSLRVINYGVGIEKGNLSKIFEPFYCVDKSRSKKLGGSGLGLAITKEILEEHGFSISAESVPDKYTEFKINFTSERSFEYEKNY